MSWIRNRRRSKLFRSLYPRHVHYYSYPSSVLFVSWCTSNDRLLLEINEHPLNEFLYILKTGFLNGQQAGEIGLMFVYFRYYFLFLICKPPPTCNWNKSETTIYYHRHYHVSLCSCWCSCVISSESEYHLTLGNYYKEKNVCPVTYLYEIFRLQ